MGEIDLGWYQLHHIGIEIREYQYVIDKTQQHVAVIVDNSNHFALVVR